MKKHQHLEQSLAFERVCDLVHTTVHTHCSSIPRPTASTVWAATTRHSLQSPPSTSPIPKQHSSSKRSCSTAPTAAQTHWPRTPRCGQLQASIQGSWLPTPSLLRCSPAEQRTAWLLRPTRAEEPLVLRQSSMRLAARWHWDKRHRRRNSCCLLSASVCCSFLCGCLVWASACAWVGTASFFVFVFFSHTDLAHTLVGCAVCAVSVDPWWWTPVLEHRAGAAV